MNTRIQWKPLIASLIISLGTGGLSFLLTPGIMEDYGALYKPPLAPPGWVFPVVWTILFVLMGIAAYLVYISDSPDKRMALTYYIVQLGANLLWSIIFFRFQAYLPALVWLLALWYLVFLTLREFRKIDKIAAGLLIPYLLWLTFAGYLNFAIAVYYL